MEDIDKLQMNFEHIDSLIDALIPFVSSKMQQRLRYMHKTIEPMRHLKDLFKTMEMVRAMQEAMQSDGENGPDFSKLSGILSPEQLQMFEMFQSMQDFHM